MDMGVPAPIRRTASADKRREFIRSENFRKVKFLARPKLCEMCRQTFYYAEVDLRRIANTIRLVCSGGCLGRAPLSHEIFSSWDFGLAVAAFNGKEYGDDYLIFEKGEKITQSETVPDEDGWSYGLQLLTNKAGWFPTIYVKKRLYCMLQEK